MAVPCYEFAASSAYPTEPSFFVALLGLLPLALSVSFREFSASILHGRLQRTLSDRLRLVWQSGHTQSAAWFTHDNQCS